LVDYVRVLADDLRRFTSECFVRYGVPKVDADLIADHLVLANLRGVDSHGVIRIPYYGEGIKRGYVKPTSEFRIVKDGVAVAVVDGGNGLGIPIATRATDLAISKCRSVGLAAIGVRNLGHVGMLAYYTLRAVKNNLIGLATVNAPARVAPWGGGEAVFGTNPISIAFPTSSKPIVIDMATSAIAAFKIRLAALKGEKIPEGIALTKDGRPTTDPKEAYEGILLPFGGYKGYAISLAIEVLSAILSGGTLSKYVINHPSTQGGFFMLVIDPTAFRDYSDYLRDIDSLVRILKNCKPAQGSNEVLLPGEPEDRNYEERLRNGIPIDLSTWKLLTDVAKELGVELPKTL
jgi:LDH2 family malate/lactate/ureidoglycolate dehydrogenase